MARPSARRATAAPATSGGRVRIAPRLIPETPLPAALVPAPRPGDLRGAWEICWAYADRHAEHASTVEAYAWAAFLALAEHDTTHRLADAQTLSGGVSLLGTPDYLHEETRP